METKVDPKMSILQDRAKQLLKKKEEIDEELRSINREMRDLHNNQLLIT